MSYRIVAVLMSLALAATAAELTQVEVFQQGENGVSTYRIPSLITTPKGSVLAFAEARHNNQHDHGFIETVMKRSTDLGATWSSIQVVAGDPGNAIQNPTVVIDRKTGYLWMLLIWSDAKKYADDAALRKVETQFRRLLVVRSKDDGKTWSKPKDITKAVCPAEYKECVVGPGVGIQLRDGRMVIPSYRVRSGGRAAEDYVIYSDDHGKSWHQGGAVPGDMDECQVVELNDGSLMMNMRSNAHLFQRGISISKDRGMTWSQPVHDPVLVEPVCQASILRYTGKGKTPLLFSNPARTRGPGGRTHMTVRASFDEGKTWPVGRMINAGRSAYSCLTVLPDGSIGCLYERGEKRYSDQITFARFTLDWLESGQPE